MAEDNGEKTEEATQTRREDFRKRGQVAHTKELASALLLMAGAGLIFGLSRYFFQELYDLFQYSYGAQIVRLAKDGSVFEALQFGGLKLFKMIAPILGATLVLGIGASVVQTGFLQVEDAMSPDINKINPLEGAKRLFSLKALVEGLKAFLKMCLVGFIAYLLLKGETDRLPRLVEYNTEELIRYVGLVSGKLLFGIGLAMVVLSLADYFFQRWDLEKKMMMSKQEVKEEMKNREVDPMIKARIRKTQREMANKRMMQKVPTADVIVTNPTHIAVALKYGENLPAPQLVAKGADLVAEKIKEIAKEHRIPIIENKPLARTIYKTMKLGQVIPRELYVAVAEVLSYVYRLKKKFRNRG